MQEKIKYKTPLLMLKYSRSFVHHLLCAENKAEKKKKKKMYRSVTVHNCSLLSR